eukprot:TRINITY_DN63558_c0_g1_i1.p1 TRINITY_DN63558_c0_g1~~TRINITY_DN63558_c0_g1_i1.p1  ORF type:complete len:383 (+),score=86.81 TRINITY_DN63558_c0_g1_i1:153-1151(+)
MVQLAAALLDQGAALEAKTRDLVLQNAVVQPGGQTSLHLAARNGEAEVVELLLARGANPAALDFDGISPAAIAAIQNRTALAQHLAVAAGTTLPSQEALQELSRAAKEAGKTRAADTLSVPAQLRQVYTLERVWSSEECSNVLDAVKAAAAANAASSAATGTQGLSDGWTTERHTAYATTDLPCSCVPAIDSWVRASLRSRVLPKLAERHGWLPADVDTAASSEHTASRLAYRDLFFVRYSAAAGGQNGLALHRDGSIISFNILLNDPSEFEGGGTFVEADNQAYLIGQGDCFVHSGKLRHGGNPVTRGQRFVLVAFIDVLDEGETLEEGDM